MCSEASLFYEHQDLLGRLGQLSFRVSFQPSFRLTFLIGFLADSPGILGFAGTTLFKNSEERPVCAHLPAAGPNSFELASSRAVVHLRVGEYILKVIFPLHPTPLHLIF